MMARGVKFCTKFLPKFLLTNVASFCLRSALGVDTWAVGECLSHSAARAMPWTSGIQDLYILTPNSQIALLPYPKQKNLPMPTQ
jgi:hypothetical protein